TSKNSAARESDIPSLSRVDWNSAAVIGGSSMVLSHMCFVVCISGGYSVNWWCSAIVQKSMLSTNSETSRSGWDSPKNSSPLRVPSPLRMMLISSRRSSAIASTSKSSACSPSASHTYCSTEEVVPTTKSTSYSWLKSDILTG